MNKLVYIAGYGRSGSTLLSMMLSSHQGFVNLGEVFMLPHILGGRNKEECSCQQPVRACPFWSQVIQEFERTARWDWHTYHRAAHQVESFDAALPLLKGDFESGGKHEEIGRIYTEYCNGIFEAISTVCQSPVIFVDSSKSTRRSFDRPLAISRLCEFDVRAIFLIRKGGAVFWSVLKKDNQEAKKGASQKSIARAYRGLVSWALTNYLTSKLVNKLSPEKVFYLQYEQLAIAPAVVIEQLGRFLDIDFSDIASQLSKDKSFEVPEMHLVGGNRMARQQGRIQIRLDDDWESHLSKRSLFICNLLSRPLQKTFTKGFGKSAEAFGHKQDKV